jgi:hypothetical protein
MKDFFISYNNADRQWAEWIAWQLEKADYTTVVQVWDFRPGSNFVLEMQKATTKTQRTIAVLSPDYLKSLYVQAEWAAAFDPTGDKKTLIPVRVRECDLKGLWPRIIYIDLVGHDESTAKDELLKGVVMGRAKPVVPPAFPVSSVRTISKQPRFPGALPHRWNITHHRNPNFPGRENLLNDLRAALTTKKSTALTQAIHGLGGIGKTQLVLEYAYRYASEYDTVWWMRAEEVSTCASDYAELARALDLPEKDAIEQSRIIVAVRDWLDHNPGWLLIFDNAQTVDDILFYLPRGFAGHVLITSRNPNWEGVSSPFEINVLDPFVALIDKVGIFSWLRYRQSSGAWRGIAVNPLCPSQDIWIVTLKAIEYLLLALRYIEQRHGHCDLL